MRQTLTIALALGLTGALGFFHIPETRAGRVPVDHPDRLCTVTTDKTAAPQSVLLGAEVEILLSVSATCPGVAPGKADIVLAIDHSASQRDNGTWTPTMLAATAFADRIDFTRHAPENLISFSTACSSAFMTRSVRSIERSMFDNSSFAVASFAAAVPSSHGSGLGDVPGGTAGGGVVPGLSGHAGVPLNFLECLFSSPKTSCLSFVIAWES